MKNVTGLDLVKLLAGSHGTLGVLTEVAFKVLPRPEAQAVLALDGLDGAQAIAALSAALGSPYEVTGAAHVPHDMPGDKSGGGTFFRIEGFAPSVAYRQDRLMRHLAPFGQARLLANDPFPSIRDVAAFHGRPGDVWRLSLRPSTAADVAARAGALGAVHDWGGGLLWLLMPEGTDLRARLGAIQGHATLVRAAPDTFARLGAFAPEDPAVAALSLGLRARFDPRGLLNPGRMG